MFPIQISVGSIKAKVIPSFKDLMPIDDDENKPTDGTFVIDVKESYFIYTEQFYEVITHIRVNF